MTAAHQAVTRRAVLTTSLELFSTSGYKATSLERVAEKLGVTRQALYYHFRSKGEILQALFEEMMTKLETAALGASVEPDEPRFVAMLRAHLDATVQNTALVALLLHERPEIAKIKSLNAARRRRDYARLFTASYAEGVTAGQLRDIDPWIAVNVLQAAANGVSWWYHGEIERPAGARARSELNETIFSLLAGGFLEPSAAARDQADARPAGVEARLEDQH